MDTGEALFYIYISQWRACLSVSLLTSPNRTRNVSASFHSVSKFTTACCFTGTFGIWTSLNNSNLSLSPYPDMKGTSFVICIFTPECIFQVGIEILSSVESHHFCVLECISLPFHLHPSLTAPHFSLARTPVPPSPSLLSLSLSLCFCCLLRFLNFL